MVKSNFNILSILECTVIFCILNTIVSCRNQFESPYTINIKHNGLSNVKYVNGVNNISQFIITAAEIYREELQMGQLAKQKGNNKFIKELCNKMELQHTVILKDLNQLAEQREIYLPSQFSYYAQNTYQQLNNTLPEDFDKAYCDWIIRSRQESIALFSEASNDTSDMEINAWVRSVLPVLKRQLNFVIAYQKKFEKV